MIEMSSLVIQRFWSKVVKGKWNQCWLWTGTPTYQGYGQLKVDGRSFLAHRIAYELCVGPIPEGQEISHRCRNRHCMNWRHLKADSHYEHMQFINTGANHYATHKTHCANGHLYDAANTYFDTKGWRRCRECHRQEALVYWNRVGSVKRSWMQLRE